MPPIARPEVGYRPPPWSDRVCAVAVIGFALWTVCCHAVVFYGGTLFQAMVLFSGIGLAALAVRWFVVLETDGVSFLWLRRWLGEAPGTSPRTSPKGPREGRTLVMLAFGSCCIALGFSVFSASALTLWWAVLVGLALAFAAAWRNDSTPEPARRSPGLEQALWVLALGCVLVTLVSHRPDVDDAFYIGLATAAVDQPDTALLSLDPLHGIAGLPIHLPVYRLHSYELLNAALSKVTGWPAIYCFHWVSAAFAALLVPFAYARLGRQLVPKWWWMAVLAVVVALLSVSGPLEGGPWALKWYGNFAFVRLWQGKSIMLSVMVPLIFSYSIDFSARPTARSWLLLAAAQVSAVGLSSSAIWIAPTVAAVGCFSMLRSGTAGLRRLVVGCLSSIYVLVAGFAVAGAMRRVVEERLADQAPAVRGEALEESLRWMLGDSRFFVVAMAALLLAWACCPSGVGRRFAAGVPFVLWAVLLNPYWSRWVESNLTGPSYWRALWALPLPMLVALFLTAPMALGERSGEPRRAAVLTLALMVLFVLSVPTFSGLSRRNQNLRLGLPGLKVQEPMYEWAGRLNAAVPTGSRVVAPREIGEWVPTYHQHAFPLTVRNYLKPNSYITSDEARLRRLMTSFTEGRRPKGWSDTFLRGLDQLEVQAVCLRSNLRAIDARRVLTGSGFCQNGRSEAYEIWVRCPTVPLGEPPASDDAADSLRSE
ncbi:MAG: hypothetical protein K8J08_00450 [Thermoanaerobaculia bacterium]|nr:hypothetical protein [Thermoanaerobaculia bacterium]